jgi:16S rRNA (guanine1207-N2)-methyltransferase
MPSFDFVDHFRRFPEVDEPDLMAIDGTDRFLLDELPVLHADALRHPGAVTVVDDQFGVLTLGVISLHGASDVRVLQDSLVGERALEANAGTFGRRGFHHPQTDEEAFENARLVVMRLPKSNDRLDEIARAVARYAAPDVVLVAGGRTKHMTFSQNDVLRRSFADVSATRGRYRSRLLVAADPQRAAAGRAASADPWPRRVPSSDLGFTVAAHGGVFAGTGLDQGTRVLLDVLDEALPDARDVVDLGCGSGVLATAVARRRPGVHVVATDVSATAVASARLTADLAGVGDRVRTVRADAGDELDEESADLVLCNPPFHDETAVTTDIAEEMFRHAASVLRPGGELWVVWNSHLRYRSLLERTVGPTRQVTRTPKFTVTASAREEPRDDRGR